MNTTQQHLQTLIARIDKVHAAACKVSTRSQDPTVARFVNEWFGDILFGDLGKEMRHESNSDPDAEWSPENPAGFVRQIEP